ncbi:hypothetical protein [Paenibacillus polymyxa]|uniref:Uncharacterized protein n=1 Tax=Paenibacillus polymyxa TaxID=1406 RepID=A0ABX2ZH35_PAEPO|nr:hypothetical protein [Paenibacillus polymyxa]ODA10529.1 hypothetical protein A7312_23540 [Paenibacillus polymyxa]
MKTYEKPESFITDSLEIYDALIYIFGGYNYFSRACNVEKIIKLSCDQLDECSILLKDKLTTFDLMQAAFHGYKYSDPIGDAIKNTVEDFFGEDTSRVGIHTRVELSKAIRKAIAELSKERG